MTIEGKGRRQSFPLHWTLAVLVVIAAALALSRLAPAPGSAPAFAPMSGELHAALTRGEPGFQMEAYDSPLLGRRAALWVGRGYLSPPERQELLAVLDDGLERIEAELSRTVEEEYGRGARVHYFARGGAFVSHTLGGYRQRRLRQPVVFLSFAHERRAPYLHESVHVVAPEWSALWLREGLAVFLSRRLSRSPMLMRLGGREIDLNARDAEAQARACLATQAGQAAWSLVGQDGVPEFSDRDVRTAFYLLSGALVERLDAELGREALLTVYRSSLPARALEKASGQSIEAWKGAWVRAGSGEGAK